MRKQSEDFIGTCQACFGEWKVDGTTRRVALHGYKRPGNGGISGGCEGGGHPPFEYSCALTKVNRDSVNEAADYNRLQLEGMEAGTVTSLPFRSTSPASGETTMGTTKPGARNWSKVSGEWKRDRLRDLERMEALSRWLDEQLAGWKEATVVGIDVPATGRKRALLPPHAERTVAGPRKDRETAAAPARVWEPESAARRPPTRKFRFGIHCAQTPGAAALPEGGDGSPNFVEAVGWAYRKLGGTRMFRDYGSGAEPLPGISADRLRRTFVVPVADLARLKAWLPGARLSETASGVLIVTVDSDDPTTPWMARSDGWNRPRAAGEPDRLAPPKTFESRWAGVGRRLIRS